MERYFVRETLTALSVMHCGSTPRWGMPVTGTPAKKRHPTPLCALPNLAGNQSARIRSDPVQGVLELANRTRRPSSTDSVRLYFAVSASSGRFDCAMCSVIDYSCVVGGHMSSIFMTREVQLCGEKCYFPGMPRAGPFP